jgi:fructose-specific phosphotransferase system IIA component
MRDLTINLVDFLPETAIQPDLKSQTKKEILKELVGELAAAHGIKNPLNILKALLEREDLGSTRIGQGIAIPHGKSDSVTGVAAALGISKRGIDFDALDGEPVHIFFMLIAPSNSNGIHLKILAKISRLLKDKFFRQALREVKTSREALQLIKDENEY